MKKVDILTLRMARFDNEGVMRVMYGAARALADPQYAARAQAQMTGRMGKPYTAHRCRRMSQLTIAIAKRVLRQRGVDRADLTELLMFIHGASNETR